MRTKKEAAEITNNLLSAGWEVVEIVTSPLHLSQSLIVLGLPFVDYQQFRQLIFTSSSLMVLRAFTEFFHFSQSAAIVILRWLKVLTNFHFRE